MIFREKFHKWIRELNGSDVLVRNFKIVETSVLQIIYSGHFVWDALKVKSCLFVHKGLFSLFFFCFGGGGGGGGERWGGSRGSGEQFMR